jgi:hypothetical protein
LARQHGLDDVDSEDQLKNVNVVEELKRVKYTLSEPWEKEKFDCIFDDDYQNAQYIYDRQEQLIGWRHWKKERADRISDWANTYRVKRVKVHHRMLLIHVPSFVRQYRSIYFEGGRDY